MANEHTFNQSFARRLDQGVFWEGYISACLAREGLWVIHNPSIDNNSEEERQYNMLETAGDLVVCWCRPDGPPSLRTISTWEPGVSPDHADGVHVECKSSSSGVWGRGQENPFVCARRRWERLWGDLGYLPRPWLVASSNGQLQAILPGTKVTVEDIRDHGRGYTYKGMVVDRKDVLPFGEFVTWAKGQAL